MNHQPTIIITGSSGLVGSALVSYFSQRGFLVRAFQRQPGVNKPSVTYYSFNLDDVHDEGFAGADYIIHCAYQPIVSRQERESGISIDKEGTKKIIEFSRKHNAKIIFLSTLSAHPDSRTYYSKNKLLTEQLFDTQRDLILKLGIVIGHGGGLYGRIASSLKKHKVVPLIGGSQYTQIITIDDLCHIIEIAVNKNIVGNFMIANPTAITMKDLYQKIAKSIDVKPLFITVPWAVAYRLILLIEKLGFKMAFTAQNVLGLKDLKTFNTVQDLETFGSINTAKVEPELSVVVLCYKGGETIISYLKQMEKEFQEEGIHDYELILVGNYFPGTNDRTPDIIRELAMANPKIVPVTLEKKGMLGWDVRMGFEATRGKLITFIDGDGQMPSRDIVRLYRVLKTGEFDIIKTFRKSRLDGAYRKFISNIYNMTFRILFPRLILNDVNAKPKLMTREAYRKMNLSCDGWFIDGEIMLEAMRLELNIAEVPTIFYKNEWRGSFVKIWTIIEFLTQLVLYRIKYWFK